MKILSFLFLVFFWLKATSQVIDYATYPVYNGNDLGLTYSKTASVFKLWVPYATNIQLTIYEKGEGGSALQMLRMLPSKNGLWTSTIKGDIKGKFYSFKVFRNNTWYNEVPDPYAKAVGINGKRAMVIDLKETDPVGWAKDNLPSIKANDAIIYELHVRDASEAISSGIKYKGKFLGLTEKGTRNAAGLSTGLDHLRELGVTHIHLLPCFDFNSVDEKDPDAKYNWGYDPLNYNVPEGSYSTDPYNGANRIKEFKTLIQSFHQNGLRVVMDVVYNHTALTETSNFNQLVPGYYYRHDANGKFSNATACNNETASERAMVRKFIIESMKYWVQEYHVDGFRIDLMGVHDIETMNQLSRELNKIKPGILLYGEGWTAGASPLPDDKRALKKNVSKLDHIAVFSDDIRDGIKGSVFVHDEKGFASGKTDNAESVKFGIVASCLHPQVDMTKVNYSKRPYATEPWQTITYCECHDNHVLWDKLAISAKGATVEERKQMQLLALSIVLTSQGISFLHAGTEFLRTKQGVENSFDSPDKINEIDWDLKTKNLDVFNEVKALIAMRKAHPAFRMSTSSAIRKAIYFLPGMQAGVIAYSLKGSIIGDKWKNIRIYFNGTDTQKTVSLGRVGWSSFIVGNAVKNGNCSNDLDLSPYSCTILYQTK